MIKDMKYIRIVPIKDTGKTIVWQVETKDNLPTCLGEIKWFGRWRKYSFFPSSDTVYEQECLRDIAQFIEDATKQHKGKHKNDGSSSSS